MRLTNHAIREALECLGILTHTWEVVVGNVGCLVSTENEQFAREQFAYYAGLSKDGVGTSGNEKVTLSKDGEAEEEYRPE